MTDLYFGQGCRPAHFCHDPQAPSRRVSPDHFQVYSGVRIGTIYCTHQHPGGNEWMWFLNGFTNGPVRFNGFAVTLDDAKAEFAASWHAWLGRGADRRHAHGGKLILAARPQGVNKGEAAGRGKENNEERVVKRHSNKSR
jgi:hypothetical protein